MKCEQCNGTVNFKRAWIIDRPDRNKAILCDEWCARTWIGIDRPLTRRVLECSTVEAIPQDVVVCDHKLVPTAGPDR